MKKIIVTSILLLISGLSFFCFTTKPSKVDTPKIKEKLKINISVMGDLKNEDVELVKNELIKTNLLKLGSNAPSNLLRKIYEDANMAGKVVNVGGDTFMHNFMKDGTFNKIE